VSVPEWSLAHSTNSCELLHRQDVQKLDHLNSHDQLLHHVDSSVPSGVGPLLDIDVSDVEPSLDGSSEQESEETD